MTALVARFLLAALVAISFAAQAAITCSVTSPGFAAAYDPTVATTNITQTSHD